MPNRYTRSLLFKQLSRLNCHRISKSYAVKSENKFNITHILLVKIGACHRQKLVYFNFKIGFIKPSSIGLREGAMEVHGPKTMNLSIRFKINLPLTNPYGPNWKATHLLKNIYFCICKHWKNLPQTAICRWQNISICLAYKLLTEHNSNAVWVMHKISVELLLLSAKQVDVIVILQKCKFWIIILRNHQKLWFQWPDALTEQTVQTIAVPTFFKKT